MDSGNTKLILIMNINNNELTTITAKTTEIRLQEVNFIVLQTVTFLKQFIIPSAWFPSEKHKVLFGAWLASSQLYMVAMCILYGPGMDAMQFGSDDHVRYFSFLFLLQYQSQSSSFEKGSPTTTKQTEKKYWFWLF